MKVHYKKSIIEQIDASILEAERLNKKIDFIELNEEEWAEAYKYACTRCSLYDFVACKNELAAMFYNGVKLKLGKD